MTYKLQTLSIYNGMSPLEILPPDNQPGWHIESVTPLLIGSTEIANFVDRSIYEDGRNKMVPVESGRSSSTTYSVLILWKRYEPSMGGHTDDVGNSAEAKAWA